jgi:hypothetical protein
MGVGEMKRGEERRGEEKRVEEKKRRGEKGRVEKNRGKKRRGKTDFESWHEAVSCLNDLVLHFVDINITVNTASPLLQYRILTLYYVILILY